MACTGDLCKGLDLLPPPLGSVVNNLGARIEEARKRAKITLEQLGAACGGKSPQAVRKWQTGASTPNPSDLLTISVLTGAPMEWLITGRGSREQTRHDADTQRGRVVPVVPIMDVESFLSGAFLPVEHVRSHFPCGPRAFQVTVEDRSNAPELLPNDSVIIDPDLTPSPGAIVLCLVNSGIALRRYRPRADHVELAPSNSDWPTDTTRAAMSEWLIGTVSEISRRPPQ